MADKCVVRNAQYRRGGLNKRERHNERKNADYQNEDIIKDRTALNIHYKACDGYAATFDRMVAEGIISTRGLGKDPNIVDELVFDVNSAYFDRHGDGSPAGSYDYAKAFFAEAYRCAVNEIGGEEYVLSAILHADERNKALSEKTGHDVYHYHLHVVYVPVVDKEIKWTKRCKDPALIGTTKEVIKQVSHSKKWPRYHDEKGRWINAYSLLQDRFYEHMRAAGFRDFERGERGSTAEHLEVLDYKIQQDTARASALAATVEQQQATAAALAEQAAQTQKRLDSLEKKTAVVKKDADAFAEIDRLADKRTLMGYVAVSQADWKKVSALAKEGQKSRATIKNLQGQTVAQTAEITEIRAKLKRYGEGIGINDMMRYNMTLQRAPRRLADTVADIMRKPPENPAPERTIPQRKRSNSLERG